MKTTYLYVKCHRKTGLKYFGKTIRNPYKYHGSGSYWSRHLRWHGLDYDTLEVWGFDDLTLLNEFAVRFSKENDIAASKEWANLGWETGLDGGSEGRTPEQRQQMSKAKRGKKFPPEFGEKIRLAKLGQRLSASHRERIKEFMRSNHPWKGRTHSEKTRAILSEHASKRTGEKNSFYGKKHSQEFREYMGKISRERPRTCEEIEKMRITLTGLKKTEEHKARISTYARKRKWIVNKEGALAHTQDPSSDPRILSGEFRLGRKWSPSQA